MKKSYILTFAISLVVLLTIAVVALMLLLPQQSTVIDSSLSKYDSIKKSDFVYEKTKDITKDALVHEYTITGEEMDKFRNNQQYVSGNSDPFTPSNVTISNSGNNNTTNNKNNNGSNNSSNTTNNNSSSTSTSNSTSNSNTSSSNETTQKITNSNGGQANPPSTNK